MHQTKSPRDALPAAATLLAAVLTCTVLGAPESRAASTELAASRRVAAGDSLRLAFAPPDVAPGSCLVLELDARLQAATFAGSNTALAIQINGRPVDQGRLLDKPLIYAQANGVLSTWADGDRWRVVYSPDFDPRRNVTGIVHQVLGVDPYHLVLRIDDLVQPGANVLVVTHIDSRLPPMELAHIRLGDHACPPSTSKSGRDLAPFAAVASQPAPNPGATFAADGRIHIVAGELGFDFDTEVSQPRGGWRRLGRGAAGWKSVDVGADGLRAQANDLLLRRRLDTTNGALVVHDVLVNRSGTDLGVQVRYRCLLAPGPSPTYLGGVQLPTEPMAVRRYEPQAPTAVAVTEHAAIGLVPASDALWIQAESFRDSLGIGLYDGQIGLAAGDSLELAVRILAVPGGGYEDWLDRARTTLAADFTVEGGFAFVSYSMANWPTEKLRDWIAMRHLRYVSTQPPTATGSTGLQGPALLQSPQALEMMRNFVIAVRRAAPDVKILAYFHCYLVSSKAMTPAYQEARLLAQDLSPVFYPRPSSPQEFQICVPRPKTAFATDLERLLGKFWEFGFDGVYWDEMAYSFKPWTYGGDWDAASADVDPRSHLLLRQKSAVPLVVQPWILDRLAEFERLGKLVVANTEPVTLGIRRYRFPRFVETASTMALASTQLWSPIGLGDRLREKTSTDIARRIQAHLENGALYYFYSPSVRLEAPNLTAYMYPVTPLRIRPGTVLASERILTSRSGRFGWGDLSGHEVHAFDAAGKEIAPRATSVQVGGERWTDLELRPGETAAIVRQVR